MLNASTGWKRINLVAYSFWFVALSVSMTDSYWFYTPAVWFQSFYNGLIGGSDMLLCTVLIWSVILYTMFGNHTQWTVGFGL